MTDMLFSILHPTARVRKYPSFPEGWRESMLAWFRACDRPERVEYVVSVHASRWTEFWSGELGPVAFPDWGRVVVVRNYDRDDNVTQVNAAARASSGKLLTGTMDDMFPPAHWDSELLGAVPDLEQELVVHCSSGHPRDWEPLINVGLVTRARYDRFGYIAYPGYESMYADDELTEVAYLDRVVVQRPDILFSHRHWSTRKSVRDEVYEMQNRQEAYDSGRALFLSRKAAGFPADVLRPEKSPHVAGNIPASPARPARPIRKTVALCFPGDVFSMTWNAHTFGLFAQMAKDYAVFSPIWGYSSNVYLTRLAMLDRLLKSENKPDLVLWIDDDNLLDYDQFQTLAEDIDKHSEVDLAAAWSWCRPHDYRTEQKISAGTYDAKGCPVPLTLTGLQNGLRDLVEVGYTGFPAVLMRYSTLERVGPQGFAPMIAPSYAWGFSGEDVAFSRRATDAGCRLFVDRRVRVPHLKRATDDAQGLPAVLEKKVG